MPPLGRSTRGTAVCRRRSGRAPSGELGETFRADLSYIATYAEDRQASLGALFLEPARRMPDRRFLIAGANYPPAFNWLDNLFFVRHVVPPDHPALYSSSRLTR